MRPRCGDCLRIHGRDVRLACKAGYIAGNFQRQAAWSRAADARAGDAEKFRFKKLQELRIIKLACAGEQFPSAAPPGWQPRKTGMRTRLAAVEPCLIVTRLFAGKEANHSDMELVLSDKAGNCAWGKCRTRRVGSRECIRPPSAHTGPHRVLNRHLQLAQNAGSC